MPAPESKSSHCGRFERIVNRRHFLQRAGAGFGAIAMTDLLAQQGLLSASQTASGPLAPRPHLVHAIEQHQVEQERYGHRGL